ncbi:outer membrane beta-barrel protein [Sphingobacterium sp. N143]|uniref:outer membrane beta-barrel family protein n=1 Tax=Sphingobacterium sp. N143 TaxID=2746727 RepID=UPI002576AFFA|nr:outer membrane beta-barrel family protein [Sphingobacterium sp. N143]MDM1296698.1 outer membrane beta-barrel protein [Sphingobacterium sp. N143]
MDLFKKLLLAIPSLLFFSISYGSYHTTNIHRIDSTFIVTGIVVDSITKEPVQLASIYLLVHQSNNSPVKTAMTNETGNFRLEHNRFPIYIKINHMGFKPQIRRIATLNESNIDIGTIRLHKIDNKLEEGAVSSKRPTLELITGGYKFNAENNIIGNSTNMAELLKQVPGLAVDEMEGKLQLLGKGATVLINGRKVNMGGRDLLNYLKSLPSNDVLSINVLTNPGAAYDATGDGGILDIILKKNSNLGFFGSANASISTLWGTDESINLNLKKDKFNVSLGYSFSYVENLYRRNDLIRNYYLPDSSFLFRQQQITDRSQRTHSVKSNLLYNIDSTSTISLNYWYAYLFSNNPNERIASIYNRDDKFQRLIKQSDLNFLDNDFHIVDLVYDKNFKKNNKLSIGVNYAKYANENNMSFWRKAYDLSGIGINSSENDSRNFIIIRPYDVWSFNADYEHKVGKGFGLKLGAKYNHANTESNFRNLAINGNITSGEKNSRDDVHYNESIRAAYSSFGGKYRHISFDVGLRLESFNYKLRSVSTAEQIKNDYLNLFPNFYVRYDFEDQKNSVSLSGNRRIERPGYSMLNPFVVTNTLGYFSNGNLHLKPYFTNRLDAQYSHKFNSNHSLILSVYGNSSKNMFTYVTRYNQEVASPEFNYYNDYNLNQIGGYLMSQNKFGARVNVSTYLSVQRPAFKSNNSEDALLPGIVNFNGSINTFITILPKTTVQILGFYASKRNSFQMKYGATGYITTGVQQKLFRDKLNISLTIEDIFNLQKVPIASLGHVISIESMNKLKSRYAKLSLSYNFGKTFSTKQPKKLEKDARID